MAASAPTSGPRVALIDYGAGNLASVAKSLTVAGAVVDLTDQAAPILGADKVVLPGVGAFADALAGLAARDLTRVVIDVVERQIPLLGICVGMQLLFDQSDEHGRHAGLGLVRGRVQRFVPEGIRVPHSGWNQLLPTGRGQLLGGVEPGSYCYFNHSYYCVADDESDVVAFTEHGVRYASMVTKDRVYGVQFHPEKSQTVGLAILRNFVERG